MDEQPRQQELDFTRGDQLGLLREAQLPTHRNVSGRTLKAVLRAIDDFGRGRPTFASRIALAKSANIQPRQVTNAVNALCDLSLVVKERLPRSGRRGWANQLRIVWSELALRVGAKRALPEGAIRDPVGAMRARIGAIRRPPYPLEALEAHQNRLLQPPHARGALGIADNATTPDAWLEVEAKLRTFGVATASSIVETARQRGASPAEFAVAADEAMTVATLPVNAQKLTSPAGAVAHVLKTGLWPTGGIVSAQQLQQRHERQRLERAAEAQQSTLADELNELEACYGATLDALSPQEAAAVETAGGALSFMPPRTRRLIGLRELKRRAV